MQAPLPNGVQLQGESHVGVVVGGNVGHLTTTPAADLPSMLIMLLQKLERPTRDAWLLLTFVTMTLAGWLGALGSAFDWVSSFLVLLGMLLPGLFCAEHSYGRLRALLGSRRRAAYTVLLMALTALIIGWGLGLFCLHVQINGLGIFDVWPWQHAAIRIRF